MCLITLGFGAGSLVFGQLAFLGDDRRVAHRTLQLLSLGPCWLPFVPRCQSRAPAWVQLWVHYGSNKRCVRLFSALYRIDWFR